MSYRWPDSKPTGVLNVLWGGFEGGVWGGTTIRTSSRAMEEGVLLFNIPLSTGASYCKGRLLPCMHPYGLAIMAHPWQHPFTYRKKQ